MTFRFNPITSKLDISGADAHNLGYFPTYAALVAAYPVASAGDYALLGDTDTFRVRDTTTATWLNSGIAPGSDHALLTHLTYATAGHTGFEPTVSRGNISTTTTGLTIGGTGKAMDAALTIDVATASAISHGLLTDTDWSIFNGKVSSVSGVAPIISSGGTTPAISIPKADATTDGYLSSTDWNTFSGATGDVIGPGSALSSDICVFDGVSGKLIADCGYSINDIVNPPSGHGSPIGIVTPKYRTQHYIDVDGPTIYHAYGLSTDHRIS